MPKPDTQPGRAPDGLADYIARLTRPGRDRRTMTVRAVSESEAMDLILAAVQTGTWQGWQISDVMTVAEAIARREGRR